MKKSVNFLFPALLAGILLLVSVLAASQTVSFVGSSTGEVKQYKIYNISVQNTNASGDIDNVSIELYGLTVDAVTSGTSTGVANTGSGSLFFFSGDALIAAGATQYFWFNLTSSQIGSFKLNVTSWDNQSVQESASENKTITISDTANPTISFESPTPANNDDLDTDSIPVNVSASDDGSGLRNITIYLYNSTSLVSSYSGTSSPLSHSFADLDAGTYKLWATAYDNANNSASTSNRTIEINAGSGSCIPDWTCEWSDCTNGTQTQTNCVDANDCNLIAPAATRACSSCVSSWSCQNWTPVSCSSGNQTRLCTDLNNCSSPDVQTRTCVVGGASSQGGAFWNSIFSSSTLFFVVLGIIVASVLSVLIVLMRLKKKSSQMNNNNNQPDGYQGYPVYSPKPPPPFPPRLE